MKIKNKFKIDYWIKKIKEYQRNQWEKQGAKRIKKDLIFKLAQNKFIENTNAMYIAKIKENLEKFIREDINYLDIILKRQLKEVFKKKFVCRLELKTLEFTIKIKEKKNGKFRR